MDESYMDESSNLLQPDHLNRRNYSYGLVDQMETDFDRVLGTDEGWTPYDLLPSTSLGISELLPSQVIETDETSQVLLSKVRSALKSCPLVCIPSVGDVAIDAIHKYISYISLLCSHLDAPIPPLKPFLHPHPTSAIILLATVLACSWFSVGFHFYAPHILAALFPFTPTRAVTTMTVIVPVIYAFLSFSFTSLPPAYSRRPLILLSAFIAATIPLSLLFLTSTTVSPSILTLSLALSTFATMTLALATSQLAAEALHPIHRAYAGWLAALAVFVGLCVGTMCQHHMSTAYMLLRLLHGSSSDRELTGVDLASLLGKNDEFSGIMNNSGNTQSSELWHTWEPPLTVAHALLSHNIPASSFPGLVAAQTHGRRILCCVAILPLLIAGISAFWLPESPMALLARALPKTRRDAREKERLERIREKENERERREREHRVERGEEEAGARAAGTGVTSGTSMGNTTSTSTSMGPGADMDASGEMGVTMLRMPTLHPLPTLSQCLSMDPESGICSHNGNSRFQHNRFTGSAVGPVFAAVKAMRCYRGYSQVSFDLACGTLHAYCSHTLGQEPPTPIALPRTQSVRMRLGDGTSAFSTTGMGAAAVTSNAPTGGIDPSRNTGTGTGMNGGVGVVGKGLTPLHMAASASGLPSPPRIGLSSPIGLSGTAPLGLSVTDATPRSGVSSRAGGGGVDSVVSRISNVVGTSSSSAAMSGRGAAASSGSGVPRGLLFIDPTVSMCPDPHVSPHVPTPLLTGAHHRMFDTLATIATGSPLLSPETPDTEEEIPMAHPLSASYALSAARRFDDTGASGDTSGAVGGIAGAGAQTPTHAFAHSPSDSPPASSQAHTHTPTLAHTYVLTPPDSRSPLQTTPAYAVYTPAHSAHASSHTSPQMYTGHTPTYISAYPHEQSTSSAALTATSGVTSSPPTTLLRRASLPLPAALPLPSPARDSAPLSPPSPALASLLPLLLSLPLPLPLYLLLLSSPALLLALLASAPSLFLAAGCSLIDGVGPCAAHTHAQWTVVATLVATAVSCVFTYYSSLLMGCGKTDTYANNPNINTSSNNPNASAENTISTSGTVHDANRHVPTPTNINANTTHPHLLTPPARTMRRNLIIFSAILTIVLVLAHIIASAIVNTHPTFPHTHPHSTLPWLLLALPPSLAIGITALSPSLLAEQSPPHALALTYMICTAIGAGLGGLLALAAVHAAPWLLFSLLFAWAGAVAVAAMAAVAGERDAASLHAHARTRGSWGSTLGLMSGAGEGAPVGGGVAGGVDESEWTPTYSTRRSDGRAVWGLGGSGDRGGAGGPVGARAGSVGGGTRGHGKSGEVNAGEYGRVVWGAPYRLGNHGGAGPLSSYSDSARLRAAGPLSRDSADEYLQYASAGDPLSRGGDPGSVRRQHGPLSKGSTRGVSFADEVGGIGTAALLGEHGLLSRGTVTDQLPLQAAGVLSKRSMTEQMLLRNGGLLSKGSVDEQTSLLNGDVLSRGGISEQVLLRDGGLLSRESVVEKAMMRDGGLLSTGSASASTGEGAWSTRSSVHRGRGRGKNGGVVANDDVDVAGDVSGFTSSPSSVGSPGNVRDDGMGTSDDYGERGDITSTGARELVREAVGNVQQSKLSDMSGNMLPKKSEGARAANAEELESGLRRKKEGKPQSRGDARVARERGSVEGLRAASTERERQRQQRQRERVWQGRGVVEGASRVQAGEVECRKEEKSADVNVNAISRGRNTAVGGDGLDMGGVGWLPNQLSVQQEGDEEAAERMESEHEAREVMEKQKDKEKENIPTVFSNGNGHIAEGVDMHVREITQPSLLFSEAYRIERRSEKIPSRNLLGLRSHRELSGVFAEFANSPMSPPESIGNGIGGILEDDTGNVGIFSGNSSFRNEDFLIPAEGDRNMMANIKPASRQPSTNLKNPDSIRGFGLKVSPKYAGMGIDVDGMHEKVDK